MDTYETACRSCNLDMRNAVGGVLAITVIGLLAYPVLFDAVTKSTKIIYGLPAEQPMHTNDPE